MLAPTRPGPAAPDRLAGVIDNPRRRLQDARLYLLCETIEEQRLEAALDGGVDIVELLEGAGQRRKQGVHRH